MTNDKKLCQGQLNGLTSSSVPLTLETLHKRLWSLRLFFTHFIRHLNTKGLRKTAELTLSKALNSTLTAQKNAAIQQDQKEQPAYIETLGLKPGELVEVKSEQEILATLDKNKRNKGLCWTANMQKFCGKRYRVFKRLETMILENSGELRKVKNTVLLENVLCNGEEFYGCDRSCFHYWREVWLRRVNEKRTSSRT